MWTVVQVGFILVVLLLACFFVGKKIGERRFARVHEEMKALEKSFNQLLEQMELVSGHNLKVLETKTEELRDMLHAADKKCLYANDLLSEIETARREWQSRLTAQSTTSGPGAFHEKKLRMEMQEWFEEVQGKILMLERRLDELERASRVGLLRKVPEPLRSMAVGEAPAVPAADPRRGSGPPADDGLGGVSTALASLVERVSHLAATAAPADGASAAGVIGSPGPMAAAPRTTTGASTGRSAPVAPVAPAAAPSPVGSTMESGSPRTRVGLSGPAAGDKVIKFKAREEPPASVAEIPPLVADDEIPATARLDATDEPSPPSPSPAAVAPAASPAAPAWAAEPPPPPDGLPLPEPGTPFHDVLQLARQGVSIPQIARMLNIGKGEVELIMNIYGARSPMRKVL
ncbi:MAG: Proline-rich protein [Candidatus Ozemobacter sibiricus]|uniref:Proline-rich protein n=1 Tax=Candidatus Ozemobacter sibiricus TaxID=2268124 RepID=A0A367ZQL5_9BACT|nr:MAG: Proline-rich protein [Candidatus Ozemobacter sibiricus]